jgi:hypothetical protein
MNILKWIGTILLILANVCRAYNFHVADMLATLIGAGIWGYAAWKTDDRALLTINLISVLLMIVGIYNIKGDLN